MNNREALNYGIGWAMEKIERLTAENEAIRKDRDDLLQQALGVEAERDIARMENERLRLSLSDVRTFLLDEVLPQHIRVDNACTCVALAIDVDQQNALKED